MSIILVTGSNGFVGRHLCESLVQRGYSVRRASRRPQEVVKPGNSEFVAVGNIDSHTDWSEALRGVDSIVHLAARVHMLKESSTNPLADFRAVNRDGTEALATQAAKAGIRRFVYVSSIKASVAKTTKPQLESDVAKPTDPYGQSKREAEETLLRIALEGVLQPVIIRPPLVYGPGVGGNFLRLLSIVSMGLPTPLKGIDNRRSLVGVHNLADMICHCLEDPRAVGEIFNVADGVDLSTPELLQAIGHAVDRRARNFRLPVWVLRLIFRIIGRLDDFDRLCGSLQISIEKANMQIDWVPPISMDDELRQTAEWYNEKSRPENDHRNLGDQEIK